MNQHSHNWNEIRTSLTDRRICSNMALRQILVQQTACQRREVEATVKTKSTVLRENGAVAKMRRRLSTALISTNVPPSPQYQHNQKRALSLGSSSRMRNVNGSTNNSQQQADRYARNEVKLGTPEITNALMSSNDTDNLMQLVRRGSDPMTDVLVYNSCPIPTKKKRGRSRSKSIDEPITCNTFTQEEEKQTDFQRYWYSMRRNSPGSLKSLHFLRSNEKAGGLQSNKWAADFDVVSSGFRDGDDEDPMQEEDLLVSFPTIPRKSMCFVSDPH